ncbi:MAG: hypothetical protein OET44_15255 [Gammaproteobacteria bacterium]|nr:hypothetical protein [Gammaproteobacteria bacterium]
MRYGCAIAIFWLLTGGPALAQSDTEAVDLELQQKQADDLRAMEEQRAELLRELEQLRDDLAASEVRIAASRERIRNLQSQQTQSKP